MLAFKTFGDLLRAETGSQTEAESTTSSNIVANDGFDLEEATN
jgi:hypothetical protein